MIMRVTMRVTGRFLRCQHAAHYRDTGNPPGIVLCLDPAMLCHIRCTRVGADHQKRFSVIIDGYRFQPVGPAQSLFYGTGEFFAYLLL